MDAGDVQRSSDTAVLLPRFGGTTSDNIAAAIGRIDVTAVSVPNPLERVAAMLIGKHFVRVLAAYLQPFCSRSERDLQG